MPAPSKKTRAEKRAADPAVQERAAQHERDRQLRDERAARDLRRAVDAAMLAQAGKVAAVIHQAGGAS
jgi:hypothetical protein